MSQDKYLVSKGDSLTSIARRHGMTPQAIADANHLTNINRIHIGQTLLLPKQRSEPPQQKAAPKPVTEPTLFVQFVDVLNQPINNLKVMIEHAGQVLEHLTDSSGKVPALVAEKAGEPVVIKVEKATGGWKELKRIIAETEATYLRLRSPKIMLKSEMRPHEGGAQPEIGKPQPRPPGTVVETRSPAGNPVQQVSLECPNKENLKLGTNFKYRDIILAASKRSGIAPQAIAAIMNAEAAKIVIKHADPIIDKKTGKQAVDKNGKPRFKRWNEDTGEWDAKSASSLSSARGMTQFLDGSWIDQALTEGTYLNEKARKEGWVTIKQERVVRKNVETTVNRQAFKLSDGSLVAGTSLAATLSRAPYLTGRAAASDSNLQRLLDLRFDAEFSINAAVEYGRANLQRLGSAGFSVSLLSDNEKAYAIYLCHHLGVSDAKAFIGNSMSEDHAKYLLESQVGDVVAQLLAKDNEGKFIPAHRHWLHNFMQEHITCDKFMCVVQKNFETTDIENVCHKLNAKG